MRLHQQHRHLQQVAFVERGSVDPLPVFIFVRPFGNDDGVRIALRTIFGKDAHAERSIPQFEERLADSVCRVVFRCGLTCFWRTHKKEWGKK